jgi:hypothetical protein
MRQSRDGEKKETLLKKSDPNLLDRPATSLDILVGMVITTSSEEIKLTSIRGSSNSTAPAHLKDKNL